MSICIFIASIAAQSKSVYIEVWETFVRNLSEMRKSVQVLTVQKYKTTYR